MDTILRQPSVGPLNRNLLDFGQQHLWQFRNETQKSAIATRPQANSDRKQGISNSVDRCHKTEKNGITPRAPGAMVRSSLDQTIKDGVIVLEENRPPASQETPPLLSGHHRCIKFSLADQMPLLAARHSSTSAAGTPSMNTSTGLA